MSGMETALLFWLLVFVVIIAVGVWWLVYLKIHLTQEAT